MSAGQKLVWLVGGIVALLIAASLIGQFLRARASAPESIAVIDNLIARVRSWWWMVAVFAAAFLLGKNATIVMFAFISFFALREFMTLTPMHRADHRALSLAFFIGIPFQYWLVLTNWYGMFAIFLPVYGFLLLPSVSALAGDVEGFLERSAKIQWGLMIAVYCISHVPALLTLDIPGFAGQNALLLFYLVGIVQISDVLQYVSGKLFGRTKIAPVVSPSKTLEGLLGGGAGAIVIGAAMAWITPFNPLQSAAMAFVIVAMGFLGGLVLSAVKRSLGVKDWGDMIKGHGGMLDRMDSIVFSAPIFFHVMRYFFT
jgi:phosphatidate cytidylyltransferase